MNIVEKVGIRRSFGLLLFNINKLMFGSGPVVLALIFCISGVLQPTIVEFLTLSGAFDKSTLLIVLPNYIGMSFAIFSRYEVVHNTLQFVVWRDMILLAIIDIVSQGLCLIGLVYAGSSIYIIIYSSTTIWAAIWSYFLLARQLICKQWSGIIIVVFGLSITAYDGKNSGSANSDNSNIMIGIALILLGSSTHALTWVLIEKWTQQPNKSHTAAQNDVVAPELVSSLMGLFGTIFYTAWQIVYTIPRWEELVLDPIAERDGNIWHILFAYVLLAFMGYLHAVSFYHLLGHVGSVATGVMKGVQSVAVLVLSHKAFCDIEYSQCFTIFKGCALVVVLSGVYIYMANTTKVTESSLSTDDSSHKYERIRDSDMIRRNSESALELL